ncbi:MAG TPA: tetratricopeptide repeat protein [Vicinamibacterales bacterium]
MDRQHRRDLKRDKFVDEVGSLTTRAKENQRLLYIITAAVVILAVVGYGVYFYGSNREQKAQAALGTAITAIDSPLVQAGVPNPDAKYKTEQERIGASEAMFRDVQKNYSGTKAADVANIYLARIAASKGDTATARKLLSDFISDHPKHLLVGAARFSLYQLRIGNGEAPQVTIELNAELAKTTDQVLPPDTLLALLAQSYDAQGNSEKSKDTYRRIATQYPDSPYAIDAQRRVGSTV